nr:lysylphosphatidylglycerol synthase transmembrane domain-containing protein [Odoribacter splanchnicus]
MHPLVKNTIKFFLFLAVSAFLFWLVYRDQNWDELLTVLKEDVNYFWIGVACVMGIASHVSRALRWQLLTASMGYRISFGNSFMGVMIGYFANLAIPRMGEFTRCGVVSKYEEVPFSKLLGTVVTERVIDMMILLFLTLIVVITQFKQVGIFLDNNQEIEEKVVNMFHSSWMLLVLVVLAAVGWLFWRLIRKTRFKERIHSFFKGLKEGLLSVKDVRHKGLFVFYSLFIWVVYLLVFYVWFFCFQFTSHLGALVGLTIFVLSSYGMVAPVQGGIGAWHFMVIAALMIYLPHTPNIESMAKTFALLTHGTMTLLYIVVGVICVILLPLYNNAAGKQGKDRR